MINVIRDSRNINDKRQQPAFIRVKEKEKWG